MGASENIFIVAIIILVSGLGMLSIFKIKLLLRKGIYSIGMPVKELEKSEQYLLKTGTGITLVGLVLFALVMLSPAN